MRALAAELDDADIIGLALCRSIGRALGLGETGDERTWIGELRALANRTASERWSLEATLAEARMLTGLGDVAGATALLAQAETVVRSGAESELAFEYWTLRSFISASESLAAAAAYLNEARSLVRGSRILHVRYLRAACNLADRGGDVAALRRLASELLQNYADIGDVEGQGLAHQNLAITGWYTLDLASQREHFRRALEAFARTGKRAGLASVLLNRAVCAQHVGAFDAAEADYREARAVAEETGRRILVGLCDADLASLATFREDYDRARDLALQVLEPQDYDAADTRQTALLALGVAERELGEADAARVHLEEALAISRARDPRVVLEILIDLVPAYLALGEPARALECADELERGLRDDRRRVTFPAHALQSIATALFAAGKHDRAREVAREAAELLETLVASLPEEADRSGYRSLPIHRGVGVMRGASPA
jgi:tetratricopeptide (TPR) repeat protein